MSWNHRGDKSMWRYKGFTIYRDGVTPGFIVRLPGVFAKSYKNLTEARQAITDHHSRVKALKEMEA